MTMFETDAKCIKQREFVNIPAWNDIGYKGKGLTIFHDDTDANSAHAESCADIIQVILPEARVLNGRIGSTTKNGEVSECSVYCYQTKETLSLEEFVTKYNVSQINNSTSSGASDNLDTAQSRYMNKMIKNYNLFCTGSAGNSEDKNNKYKGAFIMVSGVYFKGSTDELIDQKPDWPWVDFSMFMGFQFGSSFAAPFLNGMAGLLRSKYGPLTQEQIKNYLIEHSFMPKGGTTLAYGYGIPILGDPTINELNPVLPPSTEPIIIPAATPKVKIQAELYSTPVKILPTEEFKLMKSIFYENENYMRMRDFEDILKMLDIEYDEVIKMPTVKD